MNKLFVIRTSVALVAFAGLCWNHSASAAWENTTIIDQTKSDPQGIAELLNYAPEVVQQLDAMNLASPSKLVVKLVSMRVVEHHWANDNTCTLPVDSPKANLREVSASINYYYADDPSNVQSFGLASAVPSTPCQ